MKNLFGPDPKTLFPVPDYKGICFLKNVITDPNIIVGDYTYYDDFDDPVLFEDRNVLYDWDKDQCGKLIIGKFCAIAHGVKFLMNGANHNMDGVTTYPFHIFEKAWGRIPRSLPSKGDTVIGNDVLIGYEAVIMPGIKIGDGAIIGARSLVTRDVPPYAVVGGNPARLIKWRFGKSTIKKLLKVKWWDWDVQKITRDLDALYSGNIKTLERCI